MTKLNAGHAVYRRGKQCTLLARKRAIRKPGRVSRSLRRRRDLRVGDFSSQPEDLTSELGATRMSGSLRCCWLLILLLAAFVVGAPALRRNQRRVTVWPDVGEEAAASKKLVEAVRLRSKHVWRKPVAYSAPFPHGSVAVALSAASAPPVYDPLGALAKLPAPQWGAEPPRVVWDAGVARTAGGGALLSRLPPPTNWTVWSQDFERLRDIINDPPVRTFATSRLQDLGQLFDLYRQNNARKEYDAQVPAGGAPPGQRDYAHVAKVDTHVHVAAVMSQEQLLRFMKRKIRCCGGDVVGANTTLAQLFARLNLDADTLTLDVLDMFAHSTFERFDIFDKSYSPAGHAELRSLFLSASNEQQPVPGAYFAELVKETLAALTPNVHLELRVSVAGKSRSDWSKVAAWVLDNSLIHPQVRWLVQVPRNYKIYYEAMAAAAPPGQPFSFSYEAFLRNIFDPMWEATLHPEQHAALHKFLALVVGFDSVNDESRADAPTTPPPAALDAPVQPGYAYELFYFAANLASVNNAREALGLTTFSFRPHSGEAGDTEHLAVSDWEGAAASRFSRALSPGPSPTNRARATPVLRVPRRPPPPHRAGRLPHGRVHRPRHQPAQVGGVAVPLLHLPGRPRTHAHLQQQALPSFSAAPFCRLFPRRARCLARHRRPRALRRDRPRARRGVHDRAALVVSQFFRHVRNRAQQRASVGPRSAVQAVLGGPLLRTRRRGQRPSAHQRAAAAHLLPRAPPAQGARAHPADRRRPAARTRPRRARGAAHLAGSRGHRRHPQRRQRRRR